jgi:hypothetical protein
LYKIQIRDIRVESKWVGALDDHLHALVTFSGAKFSRYVVTKLWSPVDLPNNGSPNGGSPKTQMRRFAESLVPQMTFYST